MWEDAASMTYALQTDSISAGLHPQPNHRRLGQFGVVAAGVGTSVVVLGLPLQYPTDTGTPVSLSMQPTLV